MAKDKKTFYCTECGITRANWSGKCPSCGSWHTMVERSPSKKSKTNIPDEKSKPKPLNSDDIKTRERIKTDIEEFDRVIGGGFIKGSVLLVGGEPGVGKSTLMLQVLDRIYQDDCLYFSGEESDEQIRIRSERLNISNDKIYISNESSLDQVIHYIEKMSPSVVVIDSIQTIYSEEIGSVPGSITQVKECANKLARKAKQYGCVTILIGHITKSGNIAGPKVMEHLVDTVIYLESSEDNMYRILRAMKNRFGSINEVGIFSMEEQGLQSVKNPSSFFLTERVEQAPGTAITVSMEGTRPFLIEIQALVSETPYGNPERTAHGIAYKRLSMLIAVLEKRAGYQMDSYDVFINIIGGLKIEETAINLSLVAAMASSFRDKALDPKSVFIGEVGLVGEIRSVPFIEQRVKEAEKFGYEKIYIPSKNVDKFGDLDANIIGVKSIGHFFSLIF